ncbi:MAG: hypothetical protein H7338_09515 [Candidatus Sericytochromatia bacterium]|nr:hypothetical protein [Candidatus Sericytochromatia bacterium]
MTVTMTAGPYSPLAAADQAGVVIYLGTLSKVLGPGFRLGFMVPPGMRNAPWVHLRQGIDRQGDLTIEDAAAAVIRDHEMQRHLQRARQAYAMRQDALAATLYAQLGDALTFQFAARRHGPLGDRHLGNLDGRLGRAFPEVGPAH